MYKVDILCMLNTFFCLYLRGTWRDQYDCKYLCSVCFSPFVLFLLFSSIWSCPDPSSPLVAVVSLVLSPHLSFSLSCLSEYVCDCWSGLGRLRPPCWTWLNVLITGSGTPMRSVNAWNVGSRSRSASYRYTSRMTLKPLAPTVHCGKVFWMHI